MVYDDLLLIVDSDSNKRVLKSVTGFSDATLSVLLSKLFEFRILFAS